MTKKSDYNLSSYKFEFASLILRASIAWVMWGGAARRMFYIPKKLDMTSPAYMMNKILHAAPGASFGVGDIIHWLYGNPMLAHFSIWALTLAELAIAIFFALGLATRATALLSTAINVNLMVIFGWMGTTCLDEWNLSAYGFAMSLTVLVLGSGSFSIDNMLLKKCPKLNENIYFKLLFSGRLPFRLYKNLSVLFTVITLLFTVGFYHYYRGGVWTKFYSRTALKAHSIKVTDITVNNGIIKFNSYINGGPDTQGLYITDITLLNKNNEVMYTINSRDFEKLKYKINLSM